MPQNANPFCGAEMFPVPVREEGGADRNFNAPYRVKPKRTPGLEAMSRCSIEASIGNRYLDGDYLGAIVEWVNRTFRECVINLGDTLYRHNLIETLGEAAAHDAARSLGDAWLARNAGAIDALRIPCRIVRWDHWLTHPEFPALHRKMRAYYRDNYFFRGIVARDVNRFLERKGGSADSEKDRGCSIDYILEELAADTLLSRQYRLARLYPAEPLATYVYVSRTDIPADLRGLDNALYVRLSFCKRGRRPAGQEKDSASS